MDVCSQTAVTPCMMVRTSSDLFPNAGGQRGSPGSSEVAGLKDQRDKGGHSAITGSLTALTR
jgi:hypothetical protein